MNLDDIAQLAGVSRATVSRVINDHPDVSKTTREKVRGIIEQHNFQPNLAARMLVTQRTRIVGVVICEPFQTFSTPYGSTIIQGISDVTDERDYAMLVWWQQNRAEPDRFSRRIVHQKRLMDGMLITSTDMDSELIEQLSSLNTRFVMMEKPTRHAEAISYVTIDNIQGAKVAIEHLLNLGRRRIAHIIGSPHVIDGQERYIGYQQVLTERGIPFDPALVTMGAFSRQSGYNGMTQLLDRKIPLDAVFAGNDEIAQGALLAMNHAGVRVPDDVALVGFDDTTTAQELNLTTIRQPVYQRGAQAAELLLDLIEGNVTEPRHVLLPTQLIVRQSCGG
jgi:LacI family transcriptional regulator